MEEQEYRIAKSNRRSVQESDVVKYEAYGALAYLGHRISNKEERKRIAKLVQKARRINRKAAK